MSSALSTTDRQNQPSATADAERAAADDTEAPDTARVNVSVVVPMLNEQESIAALYRELREVVDLDARSYEMIFVDDGSDDQTLACLREVAGSDPRVTIVELARRFGQTAAMAAGFDAARGDVIVPLDADLQNDPRDIPMLVAKLDEPPGWDIASGWRKNRQDKLFSRRFPSALANRLIRRLTWTPEIHDFGCSLKAYRREVLADVRLYGEMHRFLPAICKWRGARVTEVTVNHRPRTAGTSKYGLKRTAKVLLDLLTVKFMGDYLTKPIYFFGKLTLVAMVLAFASLGFAFVQRLGYLTEHGGPVMLNNNIFVLFAMMTFLMGIMFVMVGVLAELLVRIYHESQDRRPYKVRRTFAGGADGPSESRAPGGAADGGTSGAAASPGDGG